MKNLDKAYQCSPVGGGCGRYFSALAYFDSHLIDMPEKEETRCKTDEELVEAGLSIRSSDGVWWNEVNSNAIYGTKVDKAAE